MLDRPHPTPEAPAADRFALARLLVPFDDAGSARAQADDSECGLAASPWTDNLKVGLDLAHRLEAGLVQINQNPVVQASLSCGGVKSSGLGKEASLKAMPEHFTHKKTIMVNMA